ncbi:DNA gyrase inhibitor YacG [Thiocapsa imhoffii]|uniref:DNA gyrase inhibitor YacG n=1 Tax=Thiocapsa imhoffii TaxID=382777 RepID=A0A9X0WES4_9GAMM|nr:DNA gyrase inhibitor YacG [Thiocapsa imhoffii]MBK1643381.1 DNA gyrase inhibitor YacG [Thiocapsa imhoffii]
MDRILPCPRCKKPVVWGPEARWRPFCSERCRLIDLGEWFEETHRIPVTDDSGLAVGPEDPSTEH